MLTIKEYWVKNNGVRINYLDSELVNKHIPLFFFPGMLTTAQDYVEDIKVMAPRRCLSLSLRGRGKSDTPVSGYALDDHVSDIEAVVATYFGITPASIRSSKKDRTVALARHFSMYLARKHTKMSASEIGRVMGNKNHATVLLACRNIENLIERNAELHWQGPSGNKIAKTNAILEQLQESISG